MQRIDPSTNELVATFPAGDDPVAIAAGEDSVWTASKIDSTVTRVDPGNDAVTTATSADAPTDVVIAGGYLWILEDDTSIHQTDPVTGVVAQTLELKEIEAGPGLLAAGPDSVWGAILCRCGDPNSPESHHGVVEIRLDPDALYSPDSPNVRKIDVSRAGPIDIAVGEGAVWVTSDYAAYAEVMRFDPARGSLAETIRIEDGAAGIAAGDGRRLGREPARRHGLPHRPGDERGRRADRGRRRPARGRGRRRIRLGDELPGRDGLTDRSGHEPGRCDDRGRPAARPHRRRRRRRLGDRALA